ncbi:hypothetical protein WR25_07672 [Diploscapter pachys]|uniref:Costars domain-containing protein n=1 Tax=Diploscapter pachys TaxID=2018661 RepID=A0A2A2JP79_9BILA|nr:hypothetical protein WR25_07672 [Diploscapter pachys]
MNRILAQKAARKGSLMDSVNKFNAMAEQTDASLKKNPYSDTYSVQQFDKEAIDYGRPPTGSRTEARGIKASVHVCNEVLYLCEVISQNASGEEPHKYIEFGKLFYIYSFISDKLVGMLLRARKYGLVDFEGEMLYQRQDDKKLITMQMSLAEIRECLKPSGDPKNCIQIVRKNPTSTDSTPAQPKSNAKPTQAESAEKKPASKKSTNSNLSNNPHMKKDANAPKAPPPSFCSQYI